MKTQNVPIWVLMILTTVCPLAHGAPESGRITLDGLINDALANDPWLQANRSNEAAVRNEAVAAGALPDPRLSVSLANLPVDSLSFSQEPMTQLRVGVKQVFPGKNTRGLRRQQFEEIGDASPVERSVRRAQLARQIGSTWRRASLAARSISLIEQDRPVFEQLLEVTRSGYRTTARHVNQQDLIRAQLELGHLDERLMRLEETKSRQLGRLTRWVNARLLSGDLDWSLPDEHAPHRSKEDLSWLLQHPEVVLLDQQLRVARTGYRLATESRRPGWTLDASYAARDEDMTGRNLPDFVSVGFSMDLPLFRKDRQDRYIAAAADRASAIESSRLLKIRELEAIFFDASNALLRLNEQRQLYDGSLLARHAALTESALNAYGADEADFADVMRAYIAALNARVERLRIETEISDQLNDLRYVAAVIDVQNGGTK